MSIYLIFVIIEFHYSLQSPETAKYVKGSHWNILFFSLTGTTFIYVDAIWIKHNKYVCAIETDVSSKEDSFEGDSEPFEIDLDDLQDEYEERPKTEKKRRKHYKSSDYDEYE